MEQNIPKGIILGNKVSVYLLIFLTLCIFCFSIILFIRHREDNVDIILNAFNCSLPLFIFALCYIIWDNDHYYTSGRISRELNDLSHDHFELRRNMENK